MEVRVLGCYGGEMPGHRTTCFLVEGSVLVDAGAVTAALPLKDQARIDAILVTHSHLDHIRDIGFLADNIFGKREQPLEIYGLPETIAGIKTHVLNDEVWPDFSRLPNPEHPVLSYHEILDGSPFQAAGVSVTAVRVNHTVPAAGFILENRGKSILVSGDTGATDELWDVAGKVEDLAGLFIEVSFPNRLSELAEATCHLTPAGAQRELEKLDRPGVPVYLYHMKPQYLNEIAKDVLSADHHMIMLGQGELLKL